MSTRAVYTFKDDRGEYHVYKHFDGYPYTEVGGFAAIAKAAKLAWPLPRFEADEYAAAFVAANKDGSGNLRLTQGAVWQEAATWDVEYRYLIEARHPTGPFGEPSDITVTCYEVYHTDGTGWGERELFRESLPNVIAGWCPDWPQPDAAE